MKLSKLFPIVFIVYSILPLNNIVFSQSEDPKSYRVLSVNSKKLSISNVETYISKGDNLIENGNFEKAKENYDKARNLAKQLSGFYRDLNSAFRGVDARVPIEMDKKGRESIRIWAKSNSRLASLYIRKKQSEVAVPLLVEIIRLMSPNSQEGNDAYENLVQLGFVNTPYKGF